MEGTSFDRSFLMHTLPEKCKVTSKEWHDQDDQHEALVVNCFDQTLFGGFLCLDSFLFISSHVIGELIRSTALISFPRPWILLAYKSV